MTDPQNPDVPTPPPAYQPPPPTAPPPPPPAYGSAPPPAHSRTPRRRRRRTARPPTRPSRAGRSASSRFILSFFFNVIGLILGIVALVQSRKAGHKNGWAVAAIIISAVLIVLGHHRRDPGRSPRSLRRPASPSEVLQACQAVDFTGTVTVQGVERGLQHHRTLIDHRTSARRRSVAGVRVVRRQSRMRQWVVSAPMPSIPTVTVERSRRNTCGSRE